MGLLLSETHGYVKDIVDEALKAALDDVFEVLQHTAILHALTLASYLATKLCSRQCSATRVWCIGWLRRSGI